MIQRKVCILGSFAVGKTSLTTRFTESIFSDQYHTTIGVRIHKRQITVDSQPVSLVVWDLAGEDELVRLRTAYLRGASGYILVADATRSETLEVTMRLQARAEEAIGPVPFILVINKLDLVDEAIAGRLRQELSSLNWERYWTSARTGSGVEEAFLALVHKMRKC